MTTLLTVILSLPLAVWALGGVLAVIDADVRGPAMVRGAVRVVVTLVFSLAVPAGHRWLVVAAFGIVIALHLALVVGGRWLIESGRWPAERID